MGGSTYIDTNTSPVVAARAGAALTVTEAQIRQAKDLAQKYFSTDKSEVVTAILQALATNYAANVISSGR